MASEGLLARVPPTATRHYPESGQPHQCAIDYPHPCPTWLMGLHETELECLLVTLLDPVVVVEEEVDMVHPNDSTELLDCLDHMKQVLQMVSVLLLSLASAVSSVDSAISMTVSYMVLLRSLYCPVEPQLLDSDLPHCHSRRQGSLSSDFSAIFSVQCVGLRFIRGCLRHLLFPLFLHLFRLCCCLVL